MLKGNSNGTLALGIILGVTISIFAIVKVIGLNYCPETPCNYDYKHSHGPTDGPTQHQGWMPNPFLPNFTLQPEPNLIEEDANQYEYADLQAQENMARATNWIAWFSLLGFIAAGTGVVLVYGTLKATQDMAVDQKKIGRAQVRAYLSPFKLVLTWSESEGAQAVVDVKNTGSSPTRGVEVSGFLKNKGSEGMRNLGAASTNIATGACAEVLPAGKDRFYINWHISGHEEFFDGIVPAGSEFHVEIDISWTDVFGDTQCGRFHFHREDGGQFMSSLKDPYKLELPMRYWEHVSDSAD